MPKYTPEQKAARQRIVNAKLRVRTLLVENREAEAREHAKEHGFDLFAARLAPEYLNPAEPAFAAIEARMKAEEAALNPGPELAVLDHSTTSVASAGMYEAEAAPVDFDDAPELENGWPKTTPAVVWGFPFNHKMVKIELPDGRKAGMWKARGKAYRIHMRVTARLVASEADPVYEEVFAPRQ